LGDGGGRKRGGYECNRARMERRCVVVFFKGRRCEEVPPVRSGGKRDGQFLDEEDVGAVEEGSCGDGVEEFDPAIWALVEVVGER
jgi:hypothetical protein